MPTQSAASRRVRPPLVNSALAEARRRAPLSAAEGFRHLAFGRGFVLQLRQAEAVAYSLPGGKEQARFAVKVARSALALPAGSVLVAAFDASYRLDPGQRSAHRLARLSLLPGSVLHAVRGEQAHVWLVSPALRSIERYALEPGEFTLEVQRTLTDFDGVALTTLRDGRFVYTSQGALVTSIAGTNPSVQHLPAELPPIWRLAAGQRLDEVWAVSSAPRACLLRLEAGAARIRRCFEPRGELFDFATSAAELVFISTSSERAGERRFNLSTYDFDGTLIRSRDLGPLSVSPDDDWAARVSRENELALSESERLVAVGGSEALRVIDLKTGEQLFELGAADAHPD